MAAEESDFPRVFRGYEPEAVERALQRLKRELLTLKTELDRTSAIASQATEENARLQLELEQVDAPTFAGFGHAFDSILRGAEAEAENIKARAAADAHNLKNATERERAKIVEIAREQAVLLLAQTEKRAESILHDALSRSAETIAAAEARVHETVVAAHNDAANARRESTTEVTRMLSEATRQVEKLKSEAEREIAEMKLILVKGSADVRGTDISEALIDILRIQTDATAHRDEAESDYLAKHNEAVHTTQVYIEDSQNELNAIKAQAKQAETTARIAAETAHNELTALRKAVDQRALKVLSEAAANAAVITDAAEQLAAEVKLRAEAAAQSLLADVEMQRQTVGSLLSSISDAATSPHGATQDAQPLPVTPAPATAKVSTKALAAKPAPQAASKSAPKAPAKRPTTTSRATASTVKADTPEKPAPAKKPAAKRSAK